ncbi:hypothetical protein [Eilatimonas milleporae]|uniref:Uncharacterized protein n=1 Tax=Eilatimonas milleporae TaxID=911205 RepID=A0A3M0CRZ9_9PROT|nr:hypothetical protein [Eilatimonas milleporae]RMB12364.1 hypothetical protein BXY39_0860 [Eilatimonas milleporae]
MILRHNMLAASLLLCLSCTGQSDSGTDRSTGENSGENSGANTAPATGAGEKRDTPPVHMSFSGGGYHAHAGAAAVMMSLMDRVRHTKTPGASVGLKDITGNVSAFSSNSGGSWFLSQAAYTNKMRTALEAEDAWQTYTRGDGYFGQAYAHISTLKWDTAFCDIIRDKTARQACKDKFENADSFLKFLLSGGTANWHELAVNAVFGKKFKDTAWQAMADQAAIAITGPRQPWAEDKALVFASALLTDAPALNLELADILHIRSLQGRQGGGTDPVPGAAPVMFTVAGDTGSGPTSPFLPGGDVALQYGNWRVLKKEFEKVDNLTATLERNVRFGGATAIDVAASSSAAGAGFIDIPDIRASGLSPYVANALANFAPAFTFKGTEGAHYHGPLKDEQGRPLRLEDMAAQRAVRLADGGFIDNTAVAYMLRHMADTGQLTDGFNILAMDNYPAQPLVDANSKAHFPTGPDVAALFGYPDPNATTRTSTLFGAFSFTGIVPHVFEHDAYFKTSKTGPVPAKDADWCAWIDIPRDSQPPRSGETECLVINHETATDDPEPQYCELFLSYTHYAVKVRENAYFGIDSDDTKTGNLHVFGIMGKNAGVVPDSDFEAGCYTKMMAGVHEVVTGDYPFGNELADLLNLGN